MSGPDPRLPADFSRVRQVLPIREDHLSVREVDGRILTVSRQPLLVDRSRQVRLLQVVACCGLPLLLAGCGAGKPEAPGTTAGANPEERRGSPKEGEQQRGELIGAVRRAALPGRIESKGSGHVQQDAGGGPETDALRPAADHPQLVVQVGHYKDVKFGAFFPDGRRVLTGSVDGTTLIWDASMGKQVRRFAANEAGEGVWSMAFSPDGIRLLTGSDDRAARLWDLSTGKVLRRFGGHAHTVASVAFSPDGWRVLTGSWDNTARLWDTRTGKELRRFTGHTRGISSVAFSPDGRRVLTGGWDRTARLWDAGTGKEVCRFSGHNVFSVAFAPDGRRVLTGNKDKTARLWNAETGRELRRFAGHDSFVGSVGFSRDGSRMLTCGDWDSAARLWDVETGRELRRFATVGRAGFVAFSPDGSRVFTGSHRTARLWDAKTGTELRHFTGHAEAVTSVAFSPDGKRVLAGIYDSTARLWDAGTGKELRRFKGHGTFVWYAAFSSDGSRVLTCSGDNTARLWDTETGKELRRFTGHDGLVGMVGPLAFSPDGRRVLTGSSGGDKVARLWEAGTGKEVCRFSGHTNNIFFVVFSPDGRRVLTGSKDKTMRLWNAETGRELRRFDGHAKPPDSVAFSPDSSRVFTSSQRTGHLWDVETGTELRRFTGHAHTVDSVAFSPDGWRVLTGSWDNTARLWDTRTGKELRRFTGHTRGISSVAFSPDGKWVLTGSMDGTARLWDAGTSKEVCRLIFSPGGMLAATPDNYYLASKGALQAVAWRVGDRALPFEQFDLKYNRPDLVLQRIGLAPQKLLDAYRHAHEKRLKRMGLTEEMLGDDFHLPEVAISGGDRFLTKQRVLKLNVKASDTKYLLDRLNVSVNGVPVGRAAGIDLRAKKTRSWEQQVEVELSAGKNVIRVSALNDKGAESLAQQVELTCTAPAPKPDLYVLAVGVSQYTDRRFDLTYADKDARDLADFFQNHAKNFGHVHVRRLLNKDATRDNILKARSLLERSRVDDQVVLFFAGHGLLDQKFDYYFATHDLDFKEPGKRGLSYDSLEGLLDGLSARKRLLLMDTCHAGEVDRDEAVALAAARLPEAAVKVKGRGFRGLDLPGRRRLGLANTQQVLQELFADLRQGTGAAVIASAGGQESALESAAWDNGVFTHVLLRGLKDRKADRDGDGRVLVSELRDWVTEEVRRLTGGRQTPAARRENLTLDFPVD